MFNNYKLRKELKQKNWKETLKCVKKDNENKKNIYN